MAVNHSVMLEVADGLQILSASSPDEQGFVAAAEYFGYEFAERDAKRGLVKLKDRFSRTTHTVEILQAFPYESSRKRMSIIARLPPALLEACGGGCDVRLYCKGADNVLLSLLKPGTRGASTEELQRLNFELQEMANIALRTLVWGMREVHDYDAWRARYEAATDTPDEVAKFKKGQPNQITALQAD